MSLYLLYFLKTWNFFLQHLNSENKFGIGTVSSRLFILRMTKMAMDWNLENWANFASFNAIYAYKNHKEEVNFHCIRYAFSFMLFWKNP